MKLKKMLCTALTIMLILSLFSATVSGTSKGSFSEGFVLEDYSYYVENEFQSLSGYPKSEHNYPYNFFGEWYYESPVEAEGLLITFSERTCIEFGWYDGQVFPSFYPELVPGKVHKQFWTYRGDFLGLYDGDRELVGIYEGYDLAGKTIFVSGDSFTIILSTDQELELYGFEVTDVTPVFAEDICKITYHPCIEGEESISKCYYEGEEIVIPSYIETPEGILAKQNSALVNWKDAPDGKVIYEPGDTFIAQAGSMDLYANWCDIALSSEEVLPFRNSSRYFVIDDEDRYVMTKEDMLMLQRNLYKTFGPGPIPNPIMSIVLATYPQWPWQGSCYGLAGIAALQHYGIIDVPPMQQKDNLKDMEMTTELLSFINYYQANVATSFLTEEKAFFPSSAGYRQSLKRMYESVKQGNIVLLTFYEDEAFFTYGHAVLLTGAYEDKNGNHVLIAYDCNYPDEYLSGKYETKFIISPDFDSLSYHRWDSVGAFNWTDDFQQFRAFDIKGETDTLAWYKSFFTHLGEVVEKVVETIKAAIGS